MKSIKKKALFFFLSSGMLGDAYSGGCFKNKSATRGDFGTVSNVDCSQEIGSMMNTAYVDLKSTLAQGDHTFDYLWNSDATTFKSLNSKGWKEVLEKLSAWKKVEGKNPTLSAKVQNTHEKLQEIYETYFWGGDASKVLEKKDEKSNTSVFSSRLSTKSTPSTVGSSSKISLTSTLNSSLGAFPVLTSEIAVQTDDAVYISKREQDLESEIQKLTEALKNQSNKTKESENARPALESKIESLKVELAQTKETLEGKIGALQEKNTYLLELQDTLQSQETASGITIDKLNAEILVLNTQLEEERSVFEGQGNLHKQDLERKEASIAWERQKIHKLIEEKNSIKMEVLKQAKELEKAKKTLEQTQKKLSEIITEYEKNAKIFGTTIQSFKDQLNESKSIITKIQAESKIRDEKLRSKLLKMVGSGSVNAAADASVQITSAQGDLEDAITQVEKALTANATHLKDAADEKERLNKKVTENEKELIDLKSKNLKAETLTTTLKEEITSLKVGVSKLGETEKALLEAQKKLTAEKQSVTKELQSVEKAAEELKTALSSERIQNETYKKEMAQLQKDNSLGAEEKDRLINQLNDKEKAEQEFRQSLKEALEKEGAAQEKLQSIEANVKTYTSRIEELTAQNEKTASDLTQERSAHAKTQQTLESQAKNSDGQMNDWLSDIEERVTARDTSNVDLENALEQLKKGRVYLENSSSDVQTKFASVAKYAVKQYIGRQKQELLSNKEKEIDPQIVDGIISHIPNVGLDLNEHKKPFSRDIKAHNEQVKKLKEIKENLKNPRDLNTYLTDLGKLAEKHAECKQGEPGWGNSCSNLEENFKNFYDQMVNQVISHHKNQPVEKSWVDSIKKLVSSDNVEGIYSSYKTNHKRLGSEPLSYSQYFYDRIDTHNTKVQEAARNRQEHNAQAVRQNQRVTDAEISGKANALENTLRQLGASFNLNPQGFAQSMANVQLAHSMYKMCKEHPAELGQYLAPVINKFAAEYQGMLQQTLDVYRPGSIPAEIIQSLGTINVPSEIQDRVAQDIATFQGYMQQHNQKVEEMEIEKNQALMNSLQEQASQYAQANSFNQLGNMMRSLNTLGDAYHNIHVIRQYMGHYGTQLSQAQVAQLEEYYHACYAAMLQHFERYYQGLPVPLSDFQALEGYLWGDKDKPLLLKLYNQFVQQGQVQQ